jgi:hypothetical protein
MRREEKQQRKMEHYWPEAKSRLCPAIGTSSFLSVLGFVCLPPCGVAPEFPPKPTAASGAPVLRAQFPSNQFTLHTESFFDEPVHHWMILR